MPTSNPATPSPYTAGSITLAANTVYNLLALIQSSLDYNCSGTGQEVNIQADSANTAPILIGQFSRGGSTTNTTGLALSAANYGYALVAGASRTYRSTFPGTQSPVSMLSILSTSSAVLHVEVSA